MNKIETNGVDIHSWCPEIEESALDQMIKLAEMPYAKYCALMPDAHMGMDMPIGGVFATENVVVPNSVGVDIGCGMCAIKTNLTENVLTEEACQRLFNMISERLPVGFSHNTDKRSKTLFNRHSAKFDYICQKTIDNDNHTLDYNPIGNTEKEFFAQLGTLGGGNHFLEVQTDEEGFVWIMIHSGSRNIGKRVGDYFNALASDLNSKWHSDSHGIPFLPANTDEGKAYLAWMDFALRFAFLNRQAMIDDVKDVFEKIFPQVKWVVHDGIEDSVNGLINIHHNFVAIENHMGKNVWVHRKGATKAFAGITGIIPGSMGTNSYIVKGLGNMRSLMSCSHGAGRKMGRMEFCRKMKHSIDQIEDSMKGIIHTPFSNITRRGKKNEGLKDVSEAPQAYKDIDQVMANQEDLVRILVKLSPRISIKG